MTNLEPTQHCSRSESLLRALFVISGIVPLLGLLGTPPETMATLYSIYVATYLFRRQIGNICERCPGRRSLKLIVTFQIAGTLTELLAWSNNYLKAAEAPALFHPQLIPDLIIGAGFYGGWAVAWLLILRWFRFTVAEAFVVTGLQGIFFEQLGAVFFAMLGAFVANPGLAILLGVYVFLIHGSIVGIGLIPLVEQFRSDNQSRHWLRYPIAIVLMVALAFVGCMIVSQFAEVFGGLPEPRSIIEHPFW